MRLRTLTVLTGVLALVAAACGSTETVAGTEGCDPLPLHTAGTLTVTTGEAVSSHRGWELATTILTIQVPERDSRAHSSSRSRTNSESTTVTFVRTGFDEVIAPGAKDWDFNIQQFSITEERDQVVDFSDGYYSAEEAVIGRSGSAITGVASVADLQAYQLGAPVGTTSLDYIDSVIEPDNTSSAFDDLSAAKAAFDANQVDGIVVDLPTAYFMVAVELEDAEIVGVLPRSGEAHLELGMLFEEGSALVACVNVALANLRDAGKIDEFEDAWLNQGGNIPTLSN